MLCSEPFAVAYGLEWLEDVLVIDIGAGTVDLCRMHGTMPEDTDQITMDTAGDFVDQQLTDRISAAFPEAQFSTQMIKTIKERHSSVADEMEPVVVSLPVQGKPTDFDITDIMRESCRQMIPPIVEGLGKLVASFDPEFQQRLKERVLLAGGGSMIKGLDSAIEREMQRTLGGGRVVRIEEPIYGGANGAQKAKGAQFGQVNGWERPNYYGPVDALKIAHDMPAEFWEQLK